jgi:hypothetical protein
MKRFLVILACLAIPLAMVAQERSGNIAGTVTDPDGNALPGVTITLSGAKISPIQSISSGEGKFRFLSLFPGKDYQIKMELQGFKTRIETGIVVGINTTAELRLMMEIGKLEEQVTVVAKTPVVQQKKTQVTTNINYEMLQSLPSARDPWVVLQLTPSVQVDRENVGGVESGQQSSFQSKGSTTQEWTVDGMQITDRNSGGSPGYYDFDSFEEMNISTGMLDVEHRDPGIVINLVSRRGGNKTSLGGRFFYTDEQFQAKISPERLAELGVAAYNKAVDIKDFGFNAGGPVLKDKIWWWAAYGINQINTINVLGVNDKTFLNNYTAKVNFQIIPENRAEIYFQAGDKKKFGRDSSASYPPGYIQRSNFHFGNPTYKFQDEHMFGDNLFLSVRLGKSNAGFGMWPADDGELTRPAWYDSANDLWNSNSYFYSDRPHPYSVFQVQYFDDNLLGTGTSHEVKLGVEINNNSRTYVGGYPGNFRITHNYNGETVDWNGDGEIDVVRDAFGIDIAMISFGNNDLTYFDGSNRLAAYFSDSISFGKFNLNLGLRVDRGYNYVDEWTTTSLFKDNTPFTDNNQANYAAIAKAFFTSSTIDKMSALLPTKTAKYVEPGKIYTTISPRVGLTYDLFGTGKTILKAAYTLYPGSGLGTGYWQVSGMYPWLDAYWVDGNKDSKADFTELFWANADKSSLPAYRLFDDAGNFQGNWEREYGSYWGGFDLSNPGGTVPSKTYVDLDTWKVSLTHELFISVEHELMQDFGVSLSYSWKRMGQMSWTQAYYPLAFYPTQADHIRSNTDYEVGGKVPSSLVDPATGKTYDPGEAAGKSWYVLKNNVDTLPTSYSKTVMMDPDRRDIFWGFDLVLNKRLSNKWMMNGSVTYQMQNRYYGSYGFNDPTNMWAYEGAIYGISLGGASGKIGRDMFSRWMFKLTGLYQLPFDINVSGTISGHEGSFYATTFGIQDRTLPNSRSYSNTLPTASFNNRTRLPDVWSVNLKVEKAFKLGDVSRMYFSADLFNIINVDTVLRKYDISLGTFRVVGANPYSRTAPSTTSGKTNDIMNPFVMRLGMRFQI